MKYQYPEEKKRRKAAIAEMYWLLASWKEKNADEGEGDEECDVKL